MRTSASRLAALIAVAAATIATPVLAKAAKPAPAPQASPAAAAPAQPAAPALPPVPAASLDLARKIVAIFFPADQQEAVVRNSVAGLMPRYRAAVALPKGWDDPALKAMVEASYPQMQQKLQPIVAAGLPHLYDALAEAYAREFTTAELTDIVAFSATPAGRHYVLASGRINGYPMVVAANNATLTEAAKAEQQQTQLVVAEVKDYLAKHPDVMARIKAQAAAKPAAAPHPQAAGTTER
ncbi:MAG TPA: DUF2059 domain-containing protein [Novosphingobium sp.]|nr:DUF2059 domain-containing protein [Novosphingobium sp.]